jgi:hypothetical protein
MEMVAWIMQNLCTCWDFLERSWIMKIYLLDYAKLLTIDIFFNNVWKICRVLHVEILVNNV